MKSSFQALLDVNKHDQKDYVAANKNTELNKETPAIKEKQDETKNNHQAQTPFSKNT